MWLSEGARLYWARNHPKTSALNSRERLVDLSAQSRYISCHVSALSLLGQVIHACIPESVPETDLIGQENSSRESNLLQIADRLCKISEI